MKYRIKEEFDSTGSQYFKPQYKYWFFPFYLCWTTSYTGHDHSPVGFHKKEQAEEFIKKDIENKKITRGRRYHTFSR